jgi:hypothetical protein
VRSAHDRPESAMRSVAFQPEPTCRYGTLGPGRLKPYNSGTD